MPDWKRFIYPVNSERYIAKRFPRQKWLLWWLPSAVNGLVNFRNLFFRPAVPERLTFSKVSHFDQRVDQLCEAAAARGEVLARRSAESLNWRFASNPRAYDILTCCEGGELIAYSVFCKADHEEGAPKTGLLVDWLAIPTSQLNAQKAVGAREREKDLINLLRGLFHYSMKDMTREKIDFIVASAYDPISQKALKQVGFFTAPWVRGFYIRASDAQLHATLTESDKWFLTGFDQDTV